MTILHILAHHGHLDALKSLVNEFNFDVLARDNSGATAAAWAERGAHLQVIAYLHAEERIAKLLRGKTTQQDLVDLHAAVEIGD